MEKSLILKHYRDAAEVIKAVWNEMCLYFRQQESTGGQERLSHSLADHTGLGNASLVPCHPSWHTNSCANSPKSSQCTPRPPRARSCQEQRPQAEGFLCLPQLGSKSCCVTTLKKMDRDPAPHPAAERELHNS